MQAEILIVPLKLCIVVQFLCLLNSKRICIKMLQYHEFVKKILNVIIIRIRVIFVTMGLMSKLNKISPVFLNGKLFSVLLLVFLLLLLTCVNYFIYPINQERGISCTTPGPDKDADEDNIPVCPTPTEEKSPSAGFSILEEFLHENHPAIGGSRFNKLFLHKVAESTKLQVIHYELLSPPPEL